MFLYKQVPAERLSGLSGLNRFSLMGKPLLGLILINRIRASHGSCNHPDGLSPRKRKSVVLLLASVFCLRQTQVFTSEPLFFPFLSLSFPFYHLPMPRLFASHTFDDALFFQLTEATFYRCFRSIDEGSIFGIVESCILLNSLI